MADATLAEVAYLREHLAAAREVAAGMASIAAISADLEAHNTIIVSVRRMPRWVALPDLHAGSLGDGFGALTCHG